MILKFSQVWFVKPLATEELIETRSKPPNASIISANLPKKSQSSSLTSSAPSGPNLEKVSVIGVNPDMSKNMTYPNTGIVSAVIIELMGTFRCDIDFNFSIILSLMSIGTNPAKSCIR